MPPAPMDLVTYLNQIIDDGIIAAGESYSHRTDNVGKAKLEGAIAGFNACRGLDTNQIADLLKTSREKKQAQLLHKTAIKRAGDEHKPDESDELAHFWYLACYTAEVEWVANCLSAALVNMGIPGIVPVTARGMMRAAQVLGVRGN